MRTTFSFTSYKHVKFCGGQNQIFLSLKIRDRQVSGLEVCDLSVPVELASVARQQVASGAELDAPHPEEQTDVYSDTYCCDDKLLVLSAAVPTTYIYHIYMVYIQYI